MIRISKVIKCFTIFLCGLFFAPLLRAEPLRILVPYFSGKTPINEYVRTTLYFELSQAFQRKDIPEKGAWILYGLDELTELSHDGAIAEASWPSVRADLAFWGEVQQYGDELVVQPFLTVTPLIKERRTRPELWTIRAKGKNEKSYKFRLDIPGFYYEFEPFILKKELAIEHTSPRGMPLYKSRYSEEVIGYVGEIILFYEVYDDALKIKSDNVIGWVRLPKLSDQASEAVAFSKGMVRLLRGDWKGCIADFKTVLSNKDIPQNLRIHTLLLTGLAKEKRGELGIEAFEKAYGLNRLDKSAASYLIMGRIADVERARRQENQSKMDVSMQKLRDTVQATKVLFAKSDRWFQDVESFMK